MMSDGTLKYKVDTALQEIEKIKGFVDETRTRMAVLNEKFDAQAKQFDKLLSQIEPIANSQIIERPERWPLAIKIIVIALLFLAEPSVLKYFGKL